VLPALSASTRARSIRGGRSLIIYFFSKKPKKLQQKLTASFFLLSENTASQHLSRLIADHLL
jgi:hypothetical protein